MWISLTTTLGHDVTFKWWELAWWNHPSFGAKSYHGLCEFNWSLTQIYLALNPDHFSRFYEKNYSFLWNLERWAGFRKKTGYNQMRGIYWKNTSRGLKSIVFFPSLSKETALGFLLVADQDLLKMVEVPRFRQIKVPYSSSFFELFNMVMDKTKVLHVISCAPYFRKMMS